MNHHLSSGNNKINARAQEVLLPNLSLLPKDLWEKTTPCIPLFQQKDVPYTAGSCPFFRLEPLTRALMHRSPQKRAVEVLAPSI